MRRLLPVLMVLLVIAPGLGAASDRCIRQSRYWGGDGPAQTSVVVNGHAFFGGFTLRVADLTDPADPKVIHDVRLDGYAAGLEGKDDRVYAIDFTNELKVIDATDPCAATIEWSFVPEDSYWNLHWIDLQGDLAVVGGRGDWSIPDSDSNLMFLDVSDPSIKPPLLGSLQLDGVIDTLALGDHTAVAATYWGTIWFIDISEPSAPFVAHELDALDLIISGRVNDLAANEDLLAISDSEGRVTLIDISVPDDPEYLALIQGLELGVPELEFDGTMLHAVGSSCTSSGVCGGYGVINCFTPRNPNLLGRVDGPLMAGPAPNGDHVVAAAFKAGLRVIDLQWLTNPEILDVVLPQREAGAIAFAGPLVHVVDVTSLAAPEDPDRNTLEVLERRQNGDLVEMGSYAPDAAIWALAGDEDYVAAAMYDEEIEFNTLEVIDVSDPTTPVVGTRFGAILSVETDTMEPHLRMEGNRLFFSLADSDDILIYEIAPGGLATQVGDVTTDGRLVNFAVPSEDILVAAVRQGDTGWVDVYDIGDPSASVPVARFDLPAPADFAVSLDAEGSRVAILLQASDGIEGPYNYTILVDISDPTHPFQSVAEDLPPSRWVAMGSSVLHGVVDLWFPPVNQHHSFDVTDPGNVTEIENLGWLDVYRDRVDSDGPFLSVSRDRLEVHHYGICPPPLVPTDHPTAVE